MSQNSNERQSAPTGATEPENQEQADRPLGDAACSLSSFALWKLAESMDLLLMTQRQGRASYQKHNGMDCFHLFLPDMELTFIRKQDSTNFNQVVCEARIDGREEIIADRINSHRVAMMQNEPFFRESDEEVSKFRQSGGIRRNDEISDVKGIPSEARLLTHL